MGVPVVVSVGVSPNPLIPQSIEALDVSSWGTINVDKDKMQTSLPDLFAGGDIVRGGATVILAMGDGRKAAAAMDRHIKTKVREILSLIREFKTIGEILDFVR